MLPWVCYGKIIVINVSRDEQRDEFYNQKLAKISTLNDFNKKMFKTFETQDVYALVLEDQVERSIFSDLARSKRLESEGDLNSNGFLPPLISAQIFNKSRIRANDPNKQILEQLYDLVRGKIVVFFTQYMLEKNGKNFMRDTEEGALFQEFFHAYQYIYYTSIGMKAQFEFGKYPTFYKMIEVEGEVVTQLYGPQPLPEILDRGISSIPNFIELKEALTGDCKITTRDRIAINDVLEEIWNILDENGYELRNDYHMDIKKLDILDMGATFSLSKPIQFIK